MITIQAIESAGPRKRARRLIFSAAQDDSLLTAATMVKLLGLAEGMTFSSRAALDARIAKLAPDTAWQRCLRLLSMRDKTEHELRRHLEEDGDRPEVCVSTIARLKELGLIDDERYAEHFIESGLRAKKGWTRLLKELERRGISIDADDERFRPSEDEEFAAARALVERLPATTEKERNRILRRLITRGYSYALALRVLDARRSML
jgi:regulatory protein